MSKRKSILPPPPLIMVKEIARTTHGIWERLDRVLIEAVDYGYNWDNATCPCPITVAIAGLMSMGMSQTDASTHAGIVAAAYAWRKAKRIYSFDPDLAEEVSSTDGDLVIPVEILHTMPAPCIYIKTNILPYADGFFAAIEYDVETRGEELRLYMLDSDGDFKDAYIIHLKSGQTLQQGIDQAVDTMRKNLSTYEVFKDLGGQLPPTVISKIENTRYIAVKAVQLLLYICAENADISENPEQARIYQKRQSIGDFPREIRKWDVGESVGEQIRVIRQRERVVAKDTDEDTTDSSASSPRKYKNRPHVRRAHWHHYWVGEGRSKIVLRWINTTLVNANDGEIGTTIINMNNNN